MRRILGNVLGYGTMGIACLSVVIIIAALIGFIKDNWREYSHFDKWGMNRHYFG